MSPDAKLLSIVILTEDSGKDGRPVVEAVARSMFQLVAPGYGSHRIDFVPRDAREAEAMRGNVWKTDGRTPQDRERRVRLLRYLARQLSLPDTFVLFHIDGDRPWLERASSENLAKFDRLIRRVLPQVAERGRAHASKQSGEASPSLQLEHLLLICPFRSIEAWLYQNRRVATAICARDHRGQHIPAIEAWAARPGELDELPAPEKAVCLGKAFNLELARGLPAQALYDVKKSYAESVERLRACTALVEALERTRLPVEPAAWQ